MSPTNSSRNKVLVAGAVTAGAVLAGLGVFLYSHFEQKKKVEGLQRQLARLDISLSKLYQEILALRNSNHLSISKTPDSSSSKRSSLSVSSYDTESHYSTAQNSDEENDDVNDFPSVAKSSESKSISWEEKLFEEVDVLLNGEDKERLEALNLLEKNKHKMGKNVEFLWRLAKAHQMQATAYGAQNKLEEKKKHVLNGLEYATRALSLDEANADAHKWFAILKGMEADFVSIKEKIEIGYLFEKHILIAMGKKPNDYSLHHLLGRFKFELANMSWFEKKMAASLFAELPNATYRDAISDLLKAESLNVKAWKENRLLLARCYLGDGRYPEAVDWLNSAKRIPPRTEEDSANDLQISLLLEKYKTYVK